MRRRITILVLIAAAAAGAFLVIRRWLAPRPGPVVVMTTGPLDIRLWGIRPNAGGTIYDANGNGVRQTLGIGRLGSPFWGEKSQNFDFIFELPDTNEPPLFTVFPQFKVSEENRGLGSRFGYYFLDYEGKRLVCVRATFDRTFRRSILFGLWNVDVVVDAVNITLGYYHGAPGRAICTFKGPFKPGQKLTDKTGKYSISFSPGSDANTGPGRYARFEFNTSERLGTNIPALLYDSAGKRYFAHGAGASSTAKGTNIKYDMFDQILKGIVMITIGEKPFETTFKNVRLDLPVYRHRSGADYIETMAKRLNLKLAPEKLAQYRFESAAEALKVVDIVRDGHIYSACEAILYGGKEKKRFDPASLSAEQKQRLKRTALAWTEAMDPFIRGFAVKVGLQCKWAEFVEPALELLEHPSRRDYDSTLKAQSVAAYALQRYAGELSEEQVLRIADLLSGESRRETIAPLRMCLIHPETEGRVEALRELAEDGRVWLWWQAIERLVQWRAFEGKYDSLPEKLKVRLFLIKGPHGFSNADQIADKAYDLLAGLLTRQLRALDSDTFNRVLRKIAEHPDRRFATLALVNFLRSVEYYDNSDMYSFNKVVKYINLWHTLNIGELGTDVTQDSRDIHKRDWTSIIAEAIKWYEGTQAGRSISPGGASTIPATAAR